MTQIQQQQQRQPSTQAQFKEQVGKMREKFRALLPAHIDVDQFEGVITTAFSMNPDLAMADRASLFSAASMAAKDGLLPDGREGVLNIFNTKDKATGQFVKKVQWLPMIGGILKKMHQSGDIDSIMVEPVNTGDQFDYWIDDSGAHLRHRPAFGSNKGQFSHMYAYVMLRSGGRYIEIMDKQELDKIKGLSKSGSNGPWGKFEDQMRKKTILHRLAKRLPLSTDIMSVINRVEDAYDFGPGERDVTPRRPASVAEMMRLKQEAADQEQPQQEGEQ